MSLPQKNPTFSQNLIGSTDRASMHVTGGVKGCYKKSATATRGSNGPVYPVKGAVSLQITVSKAPSMWWIRG